MQCYYNQVTPNGIRYRLVEGVRFRNSTPSAWAHVLADCSMCNQSIGIDLQHYHDESRISNEDAASIFRFNGWDINLLLKPKKILCPFCKKKKQTLFTVTL